MKLTSVFPYPSRCLPAMVFSLLFLLPSLVRAQDGRAFQPGDHFSYDLKWGILKVGEAEMIVEACSESETGDLKFTLRIRTTSWADTFYKVRNHIESRTDAEVTRSLYYRKTQVEGSREKDIVVSFDWDEKKAQYTNFGEIEGKLPVELEDGTYDPFSILFAFRMHDMPVGEKISMPVTDGKKMIQAEIHVTEKERLKVKAGKFDCVHVVPDIKDLGGVFSKSKDASMDLWFTDDEHRIIVKMSSKVSVGSFRAELREYTLGESQ